MNITKRKKKILFNYISADWTKIAALRSLCGHHLESKLEKALGVISSKCNIVLYSIQQY